MLDTVPLQDRILAHADRYARWSGLGIGVVGALQFGNMRHTDITQPLVFATAVFGLCAVGGVLLGDALTLRPWEAVRTASVAPRLVRDHVPPRMWRLLVFQAVSLGALLALAAITSSSSAVDRTGEWGRALTVTCDGAPTLIGPWPGVYYSGPMFAALAVGTPVCVWALRRIAHGPGGDQQRRDRAWAITGAWGLLVSSQVMLAVLMIFVTLTDNGCAGPLGAATLVVLCPLGLLALFSFGWSLLTVVAPRAVEDEAADGGVFDDE